MTGVELTERYAEIICNYLNRLMPAEIIHVIKGMRQSDIDILFQSAILSGKHELSEALQKAASLFFNN